MKLCEYRPIGGADRYPEDNANSMLEIHYCGAVGLTGIARLLERNPTISQHQKRS
jgi:hypothetical protein